MAEEEPVSTNLYQNHIEIVHFIVFVVLTAFSVLFR